MSSLDTTIYREQSTRTYVEWTPQLLRSARLMADGGTLRLLADLVEDMFGDGRVQGVLRTRILGLLGLPLEFKESGDKRRASSITDALEEDFWKAFPEQELSQLARWGIVAGVGLGELVWDTSGDRVIPRLKVWHPRWLRFDWLARQWMLTVDGGSEIVVTPGDGKWILYTPHGAHRPWAHATWRAIATPWLVKREAIQDWARYSEVHGSPIRVGTTPTQTTPEQRKQVASDIGNLGSDTTIALPQGYDLKLVEAVGRSWEGFKASQAEQNTEIAIALVGQNLTTEVKEGSRAAATVHDSVKQDIIDADAQTLSTCLREQALTWWAEFNFGNAALAPWPKWITEPPTDKKAENDALGSLMTGLATAKTAALPVDIRAILEDRNVPATESDPAPTQPAAPAGLAALLSLAAKGSGQGYVDRLGDLARDAGSKLIAGDVDQVLHAIETATSFEQLRTALPHVFAAMDPADLAELVKDTLILGNLVGRYQMKQEQDA